MQIRQEKGCYTLYKENEAIGTAVVDGTTILRLEVVPRSVSYTHLVSPAIEFRAEGWVTGVGARIFGIAGPVIAFGTLASFVWGVLYWLLGKVG